MNFVHECTIARSHDRTISLRLVANCPTARPAILDMSPPILAGPITPGFNFGAIGWSAETDRQAPRVREGDRVFRKARQHSCEVALISGRLKQQHRSGFDHYFNVQP